MGLSRDPCQEEWLIFNRDCRYADVTVSAHRRRSPSTAATQETNDPTSLNALIYTIVHVIAVWY